MTYLLLALGLFLLFIGGDWLVAGSVSVARRLKVSPLLIGLTLVGFGTSTPELITSLIATYHGKEGIAVGNVIGSNIANILLVLGVAALLNLIQVKGKSFRRDAVFLIMSTLVLLSATFSGTIGFLSGIMMVGALVFYVIYSYRTEKEISEDDEKPGPFISSLLRTIVGIILTLIGAKLLVTNSVVLARTWGVDERIIGLTVVAVGTSLPELATSIMSAIHKHNEVAFGNVVGSNIFNSLFILGMTSLFMPVQIPANIEFDLIVMTTVTILMISIAFMFKKYTRWVGALFLILYLLYIVNLGEFL
ncbi:MAG: calcium/sodium antiporter [Alphaproteobacteria bacterium]|nr:calcium/sodium antiporter [Alphaproteobacteria bacterium]